MTISNNITAYIKAKEDQKNAKQALISSIDKKLVKRFFEFLRNNPTAGYVGINFADYYDKTVDAFDPLIMPSYFDVKDFRLNINWDKVDYLRYDRSSKMPVMSNQYFEIPTEYFEFPSLWERSILDTIKHDERNAKEALTKVFPLIPAMVENNELNIIVTRMCPFVNNEGNNIVLIHLDQTPFYGELEYNKPFCYEGITYGNNNINIAYNTVDNTILYTPRGYIWGQGADECLILTTAPSSQEELDQLWQKHQEKLDRIQESR